MLLVALGHHALMVKLHLSALLLLGSKHLGACELPGLG